MQSLQTKVLANQGTTVYRVCNQPNEEPHMVNNNQQMLTVSIGTCVFGISYLYITANVAFITAERKNMFRKHE